jgi:hypothetical protein
VRTIGRRVDSGTDIVGRKCQDVLGGRFEHTGDRVGRVGAPSEQGHGLAIGIVPPAREFGNDLHERRGRHSDASDPADKNVLVKRERKGSESERSSANPL